MPASYYIKSGGTATGDAGRTTSRSTGSFATKGASAYYDNILAALAATTPFVAGDEALISDIHSHNYASATTFTGPATDGDKIHFVSVSDTNLDQYSIGSPLAKESTSGGQDLIWDGTFSIHGVHFESGGVNRLLTNSQVSYVDSKQTGPGAGDEPFRMVGDGNVVQLTNTEIAFGATTTDMRIGAGSVFIMFGGSVTGAAVVNFTESNSFTSGGATLLLLGVDMAVITGNIMRALGAATDSANFVIDGCKLNSGVTFTAGVFTQPGQRILVTRSSDDSDIAEHQFFQRTYTGDVEDATDIWRDETNAFPGGDKVSLKALPKSNVSALNPLTFDFPTRFADLADAAENVITIYFVSTTTLTDVDVWFELIYPDGANKQTPNYLSTQGADRLAAGTEHTDDSGSSTWKDTPATPADLTGYNEYRVTLDTSVDAGAQGVPIIRAHIGIDADIYFDSEIGLS